MDTSLWTFKAVFFAYKLSTNAYEQAHLQFTANLIYEWGETTRTFVN